MMGRRVVYLLISIAKDTAKGAVSTKLITDHIKPYSKDCRSVNINEGSLINEIED